MTKGSNFTDKQHLKKTGGAALTPVDRRPSPEAWAAIKEQRMRYSARASDRPLIDPAAVSVEAGADAPGTPPTAETPRLNQQSPNIPLKPFIHWKTSSHDTSWDAFLTQCIKDTVEYNPCQLYGQLRVCFVTTLIHTLASREFKHPPVITSTDPTRSETPFLKSFERNAKLYNVPVTSATANQFMFVDGNPESGLKPKFANAARVFARQCIERHGHILREPAQQQSVER